MWRHQYLFERSNNLLRVQVKSAFSFRHYRKLSDKPSGCETMAAPRSSSSALRALAVEYKSLQEEPVEGFRVKLVNDENLFEWEVAIFGPPDTLYMGGCFKVKF